MRLSQESDAEDRLAKYFKEHVPPTEESFPHSLGLVVLESISTLNGNPKGKQNSAKWVWKTLQKEGSFQPPEYPASIRGSVVDIPLNEFLCKMEQNGTLGFVKSIKADSDNEQLSIANKESEDAEILRKHKSKVDFRFMPGSSPKRLRRFAAAVVIMRKLSGKGVQTKTDLVEWWKKVEKSGAPQDDALADSLCKVSGFTLDVGLAQIRRQCGDETAVKWDRRLDEALLRAAGIPKSLEDKINLFRSVAKKLGRTPAQLDHDVWNFMNPKRQKEAK